MSVSNYLIKHPMTINLTASLVAAIVAYLKLIVFDNINMFLAIFFVVVFDFVFGVIKAFKFGNFETRKAMKVVYYLSTYWAILFVVLTIEIAHPAAFWLSEAIFLPIILFQFVSALKNASLLGAIPQGLLLKILESIDKHKDRTIEQVGDLLTDAGNGKHNGNPNQNFTDGYNNNAADTADAPANQDTGVK